MTDYDYDEDDLAARPRRERAVEEQQKKEDEEPTEEDLVTEDYVNFWRHDMRDNRLVVVVPPGEEWQIAVRAWMEAEDFRPNVWAVSDHGNTVLLNAWEDE